MNAWRMAAQEPDAARALAAEMKLPDALGQALLNRGLRTAAEADRFLRPRLSSLGDPFELPGMAAAAGRILRAVRGGERIVIFGDYDADGVTSAALLCRVMQKLGGQVRTFLPHRVQDGYGLGRDALERCLAAGGADLVVTVDCGTNASEAASVVREAGADLVITDHHQPAGPPPPAAAVVNPQYAPSAPWRDLAGVGVAFKVAHALVKQGREENLPGADAVDLREVLDWVALGTVADAAPLVGENRVLTRFGLARALQAPSPGVAALCDVAGVRDSLDAWHLGFLLGPRLNAAGRLGSADDALDLLLSPDRRCAQAVARRLDRLNQERQRYESRVLDAAIPQVDAGDAGWDGRVAAAQGWHPGVIGIVAARLSQRFHCPVIVLALNEDGSGRGSGRSPEGFDLIEALKPCSACLDRYGGHAAAVGLDLKPDALAEFREAFSASVRSRASSAPGAVFEADGHLGLGDADERMMEAMDAFRPFGRGNPAPLWIGRGVRVVSTRTVGRGLHRNFRFADGGVERAAIGFHLGGRSDLPPRVDILYEVQRNTYAGRTSIQLKVLDWRPDDAG